MQAACLSRQAFKVSVQYDKRAGTLTDDGVTGVISSAGGGGICIGGEGKGVFKLAQAVSIDSSISNTATFFCLVVIGNFRYFGL